MAWMTDDSDIVEWLYSLKNNDTFAIRYGDSLELTEYATVVEGPYTNRKNYYETGLAEPYNVVVKVELRRNPSADFADRHSISYDPESENAYVKKGVSRFETLRSICTKPLDVRYQSDKSLVARCEECGTETEIGVDDGDLDPSNMRTDSNGNMITPCCFSENWETKLADD